MRTSFKTLKLEVAVRENLLQPTVFLLQLAQAFDSAGSNDPKCFRQP